MKRYFAAGGLIFASIAYFFTQHTNGDDRHQIVPPDGLSSTTSGAANAGAPFGSAVTSSSDSASASSQASSHSASSAGTSRSSGSSSSGSSAKQGKFANGTYTGSVADAYYGYVQVEAVVSGGALTDVKVLQYPNDRSTSRYINSQALPYLVQEAVQAQSANVNTVSGASDTSAAFRQSLSAALSKA